MTHLKIKDKAPDFQSKNQHGQLISLKNFNGKKIILYFYPKDDTPGCTAQSCNLRDNYSFLLKQGYEVVGVSMDSEASHLKFIQKYDLPFNLIADTDKKIVQDYGVYGEKIFMGKTSLGIKRTTFIIDEKGNIEDIIETVDTKNHTAQIVNHPDIKPSNE
jgi:peroxiredoxin Q/BCP